MKRRDFIDIGLKSAVAFTIVPRRVLGGNGFLAPSDKIQMGFIGVGKQSLNLLHGLNGCPEVIIQAACDVDDKKLDYFAKAATTAQSTVGKSNSSIGKYRHFRELLELTSVDAVVIATPDHWHAQIAVDAAKAKKDIYCEKPLALTIAEGRATVNAARKYEVVFQTGSMQRSSFNFRHAAELVYNGYIGDVKEINVSVGEPVRQCDLPSFPIPDYLDWDMWIGPSLYRGYHPILSPPIEDDKWAWWRGYRDFGGGYITDWGAHMFDIIQWALGMDNSGPVQFIPPKVPQAEKGLTYIYEQGTRVNHVDWGEPNAIQFIGTDGIIEVSRSFLKTNPTTLATHNLTANDKRLYYSDNHYQDWVKAIQCRSKPICDVEIGQRTSTVCNAVNIAYELQRKLRWDPVKEEFDDPFANMMRSRPYRGDWSL
ncbi:Gfo/Idh/MocA family oxidoreductase [Sphingobacterium phlebotomi]|uniref:Gfo/Idh/MocA family oxidoreductase n=1 Tax=Sphingobacterium phlebotomi TaxID=2605433 RepID=A0A5D4H7K5_9SPHI|nr:Gfo/Idh/MocA family oxidoreductase [Sphingobacterium phlebotomi]TYR36668.1 Gfo/Idh/MocA family oxidoreductase [Sphingobacterium phlebotomi]